MLLVSGARTDDALLYPGIHHLWPIRMAYISLPQGCVQDKHTKYHVSTLHDQRYPHHHGYSPAIHAIQALENFSDNHQGVHLQRQAEARTQHPVETGRLRKKSQ